ncbi:hypothetical protein CMETHOX_22560 [Lacrimispora indolis]|nr:hypothetical protein CMETHOX_22560 [[Clostridium] methoxybenzovorans]
MAVRMVFDFFLKKVVFLIDSLFSKIIGPQFLSLAFQPLLLLYISRTQKESTRDADWKIAGLSGL